MIINVTDEDIKTAYLAHRTGWWVDSSNTPIAVALRRMGFTDIRVGYREVIYNNSIFIELPEIVQNFTLAFGYSLLGSISKWNYDAIKELHKSNTDHAKPVPSPKANAVVSAITFELDLTPILEFHPALISHKEQHA